MKTIGSVSNVNTSVRLKLGEISVEPSAAFFAVYDHEICHRSMALVLAQAVKSIFPTVKLVAGGWDQGAFWYDFDFLTRPKPQDISRIEAEVGEILHADLPFAKHSYSKERAVRMMDSFGEAYKSYRASCATSKVTLYSVGDFWDVIDGPMVPSTACLEPCALEMYTFKQNGKTLVRIVGRDR